MKKAIILLKDIITNIFKVLILGCLEVIKHVVNLITVYWLRKKHRKLVNETIAEYNDSELEGCLTRSLFLVTIALMSIIYLLYWLSINGYN